MPTAKAWVASIATTSCNTLVGGRRAGTSTRCHTGVTVIAGVVGGAVAVTDGPDVADPLTVGVPPILVTSPLPLPWRSHPDSAATTTTPAATDSRNPTRCLPANTATPDRLHGKHIPDTAAYAIEPPHPLPRQINFQLRPARTFQTVPGPVPGSRPALVLPHRR